MEDGRWGDDGAVQRYSYPEVIAHQFSSQLDEKLLPLECDLDDLRPREGVDFLLVLEHHQANRSHPELNIAAARVLPIHKVKVSQ